MYTIHPIVSPQLADDHVARDLTASQVIRG